jgi:hypothetical protein
MVSGVIPCLLLVVADLAVVAVGAHVEVVFLRVEISSYAVRLRWFNGV